MENAFPDLWAELTDAGRQRLLADLDAAAAAPDAERAGSLERAALAWYVRMALRSNPLYHQGLAEAAAGLSVVVVDPGGRT